MKKLIVLFVLGTGLFLFSQCSPKTTGAITTTAKPTQEEAVAEVKKNYTEEQMEEGKVIWQASCDKCHKIFEPESHTVRQWEKILPDMTKRAKLDNIKAGKVRAYILSHATRMR